MKKNLKMNRLTPHTVALRLAPVAAALILSGAATSALAQDHDAHGAHDAAAQSSAAPAAGSMAGMDHGGMPMPAGSAPAGAEAPAMNHGSMPMRGSAPAANPGAPPMDHGVMPGMDHGTAPSQGTASGPAPAMEYGAAPASDGSMAGMGHGAMQMQGGSPPADARDPNGYSDGFERGSGKYSFTGVPRLQLGDQMSFANLRVNRLERAWARHGDNATTYDLQARIGRDFNHLVIKAEGDVAQGKLQDSRTELLWGHAIAAFWDSQLGVRFDHSTGKDHQWLAAGVQGLAPYWFELDATAYLGSGGRTALRLEGSYDWLLTQKLILQPRTEWNFYGKSDPVNAIGSGLANASAGLRLRYEITRQIAPYIGVEWQHSFGRTGDFVRASGGSATQTRWLAGLSFWF